MATKKGASAPKIIPGVGLDIGTMNLVAARRKGSGVETRRMRDAFLDLPSESKKMLRLSGVNFIERGDEILIVGDAALEHANVFGREARRPLQDGLVAAGEIDALEVLGILIKHVLGEPTEEGEVCYYSIPAAPVDVVGRDVIYHEGVFERILDDLGYEAYSGNEAMAIIYSECAKEQFSGLSISFGSGMCNVALAINGIEGLTFSISRGGDWIDKGAASAVGSTQARMCALKESGIDLMNPKSREEEALAVYYKNLIEYCLKNTAKEFNKIKDRFSFPKPIPLVISGGTSLAGGFEDFFTKVFEKRRKRFPIDISEIRRAKEPLNSVAQGLLIQAAQEYED
jgi:hypothetical protein